jgi:hypothetical protein
MAVFRTFGIETGPGGIGCVISLGYRIPGRPGNSGRGNMLKPKAVVGKEINYKVPENYSPRSSIREPGVVFVRNQGLSRMGFCLHI